MIFINKFLGTAPRVSPHLLPDGMATEALNCDLRQGALIPLNEPSVIKSGIGGYTAYQYGAKDITPTWLSWSGVVDVVKAPVSNTNHRIYWTGEGAPKAREFDNSTAFALGVTKPTKAPVIETVGTPPKTWDTTSTSTHDLSTGVKDFTITISSTTNKIPSGALVKIASTAKPEEYLSGSVVNHSGTKLTVSITTKSGTSTGVKAWTINAKAANYDESQEVVRVTGYTYTVVNHWGEESAPYMPDDLPVFPVYKYNTGVRVSGLANPSGNSFSEYRIYRISVGESSSGFQYVGATTSGSFLDTKADSDLGEVCPTMTYDKPPADLHSVVSLSNGVLAAARSNEIWFSEPYVPYAWPTAYKVALESNVVGLGAMGSVVVACTQTRPYIISGADPAAVQVQRLPYNQPCLSKRSIVSTGRSVIYAGSDGLFVIEDSYGGKNLTQNILTKEQWLALLPDQFKAAYSDGQYIAIRGRGGFVFDLERGDASTFSLNFNAQGAYDLFYDEIDDVVYAKTIDKIQKWNAGEPAIMRWTSKEYVLQKPICMACYRVRGGQGGVFRLIIDGVTVATSSIIDGVVGRLPAGKVGRRFQIQVSANTPVWEIAVATSVGELSDAN